MEPRKSPRKLPNGKVAKATGLLPKRMLDERYKNARRFNEDRAGRSFLKYCEDLGLSRAKVKQLRKDISACADEDWSGLWAHVEAKQTHTRADRWTTQTWRTTQTGSR